MNNTTSSSFGYITNIVSSYFSYHICSSVVNALLKLAILHIASYIICSDTIPINNNGISFVINTNAVLISDSTECVVDYTEYSYSFRAALVFFISILEYYISMDICIDIWLYYVSFWSQCTNNLILIIPGILI